MDLLKKILGATFGTTVILHIINSSARGQSFFKSISNLESLFISITYCFIISAGVIIFFNFLEKKLSWEKQGNLKLVLGIIGSVIVAIPLIFICKVLHYVVFLETKTFTEFVGQQRLSSYMFTAIFTLLITFFYLMIGFYKALQERKVNEQKNIAEIATAKFTVLKNQLDPHFLFNSLNVLTSLIEENPNAAQKFTTSLSKVYRYVLEQKNKDLVKIEDEFKFAKTYMLLLQMRFENSIFLKLPEALENPKAKIVPLSLQLLLENAVKHNVVMVDKPLEIKIYEEKGFLFVANNLQPKTIIETGSGVGLANISQRYEMLTDRKFSVEKTKNKFIARLPILA